MSCSQNLFGINNDCTPTKGGIVEVYIHEYDKSIFGYEESDNEITSIEYFYNWKLYQFRKNTGSMTSTLTVDGANSINFVETELTLVFAKMTVDKLIEINALSKSELNIVVKDTNGKYYALGIDNPVTVSSSTGQTGTQFTDGNNYTITFNDQCHTFPYLLTDTLGKELEDKVKNPIVLIEDIDVNGIYTKYTSFDTPRETTFFISYSPYGADYNQLEVISSKPSVITIGDVYGGSSYVFVNMTINTIQTKEEEVYITFKNKLSGKTYDVFKTIVSKF